MYRRLPRGPSGLRREEVARNQRARLYGAMIEAVARHGYERTTVADVLALAGVSRRSFYEQFANKQACFRATYDIVVARERRRAIDAWRGERGWSNRMHAACTALLGAVAADPRGARLVLVEAPAAGAWVRERMQRVAASFEGPLARAFALAPRGAPLHPLDARAIVGGVQQVLLTRVSERRERELYELSAEVLDWLECYRLARPLSAPAANPAVAGIAPEALHADLGGVQDCYLAALEERLAHTLTRIREAQHDARSWPHAVLRALRELLAQLLGQPALARLAFQELYELRAPPCARVSALLDGLTHVLLQDAPPPRRAPAIAREAVNGGLWAILRGFVVPARPGHAPDSRPQRVAVGAASAVQQLAFTVLAPYLGGAAAREEIRRLGTAPAARAGRGGTGDGGT